MLRDPAVGRIGILLPRRTGQKRLALRNLLLLTLFLLTTTKLSLTKCTVCLRHPFQQESRPCRQRRRRQKPRRVERVEPEQKLTKQTEQLPNRTAFLAYGARVPETRPLPSSASCAQQACALAVVFWLDAASLPG